MHLPPHLPWFLLCVPSFILLRTPPCVVGQPPQLRCALLSQPPEKQAALPLLRTALAVISLQRGSLYLLLPAEILLRARHLLRCTLLARRPRAPCRPRTIHGCAWPSSCALHPPLPLCKHLRATSANDPSMRLLAAHAVADTRLAPAFPA